MEEFKYVLDVDEIHTMEDIKNIFRILELKLTGTAFNELSEKDKKLFVRI